MDFFVLGYPFEAMEGFVQRNIAPFLRDACADTPVVVVHGPRQCGKSTLVKGVLDLEYVTLDDSLALDAALSTPGSFLGAYPDGCIIDEVQRAPQISRSIKAAVDKDRKPGMFVLTGSANVLLLPKLSDSLAGRMEVVPLWPFSIGERQGLKDDFAALAFNDFPLKSFQFDPAVEILKGGFPEPISRPSARRRSAWYEQYLKALMERDIRDLSDLEGLRQIPRLLRTVAECTYEVLNIAALSRSTGIPATSLTRYLALLEGVFLTRTFPAWTSTEARVAKTARIGFTDTGLLCHLLGVSQSHQLTRHIWLNWVAMELHKQSTWSNEPYEVSHFRSARQWSVPIVLAHRDGRIIGMDFIDRPLPEPSDFEGLEFLESVAEQSFHHGYILQTGSDIQKFTKRLTGIPVTMLFG